MLKNKHLEKLAIILSYAGLMSNIVACGPETTESREYSIKLRNAGADMDGAMISLTQQQIDEIESGKCPEGFLHKFAIALSVPREYNLKLSTLAGEFFDNANISLNYQQVDEIKNGKCPKGFVELLSRIRFPNLEEHEYYKPFQDGLKIDGKEIIVPAIKQIFPFCVKDQRVYIYDHRFKSEVCLRPSVDQLEDLEPGHYRIEDLLDVFIYGPSWADFGTPLIFNGRIVIINDAALIQFCDAVCFFEELAIFKEIAEIIEEKSLSIGRTAFEHRVWFARTAFERTMHYLGCYFAKSPNKRYLIRRSMNKYTLVADATDYAYIDYDQGIQKFLDATHYQDHGPEYKPRPGSKYEFFLENESEDNDWYKEEYSKCVDLQFFLQSKMILKKIKFLDWEYNFEKKLCLVNWDQFFYLERLLNEEKNNKLTRSDDDDKFTLLGFKAAWESFNLEEVFAPIERELSFIESLAKVRSEDMWHTLHFFGWLLSCYWSNQFLLTQDPETKNYSMKLMVGFMGKTFPTCSFELGIESTSDSLSTGLLNKNELHMMIHDIKAKEANIFVRSIKLANKNYNFRHNLDLAQTGTYMLYEIGVHLSNHIKTKLDYIFFHQTEEHWNSIDLAEAMMPIERIISPTYRIGQPPQALLGRSKSEPRFGH